MHHLPWSVAFCNTLYGVTLFITPQCVLAVRERLSESLRKYLCSECLAAKELQNLNLQLPIDL